MKIIFVISLLTWGIASSQTLVDEFLKSAETVELGDVLPENYDWDAYISEGQSTADEMTRAYSGIKMVMPRLEQLVAELRGILKNDVKSLERFDKLNSLWQQAADIEVNWIGETWAGGTQQKAAIPKARLRTLTMRVQYLKRFKDESDLFNQ